MKGTVTISLEDYESINKKFDAVAIMEYNHARQNAALVYKLGFLQNTLTEWSVFMSQKFSIVEQKQIEELVEEFNKSSNRCEIIMKDSEQGLTMLTSPKNLEAEKEYVRKNTEDLRPESVQPT